jgi:hypothetical protein
MDSIDSVAPIVCTPELDPTAQLQVPSGLTKKKG